MMPIRDVVIFPYMMTPFVVGRESSVRALEHTSTIFLNAADLRERCAGDYHLGYELTKRITRIMLQRLQATRNRIWQALR